MRRLSTVLVLGIAGVAAVWALALGFADLGARRGQAAGVALALRTAPHDAGYLAQWSLLTGDRAGALAALRKAVAENPYYAWAWIQLGLAAEAQGKADVAERYLLEAARVDRRFSPRWALCDFYFRRRNTERFWHWARQAVAVEGANVRPVYRLAWHVEPDARGIAERLAPAAGAQRQLLEYWLEEGPPRMLVLALPDLATAIGPKEVPQLVAYTERLLEHGEADDALAVWNQLRRLRLLPFAEIQSASGELLTNPDFATPPSGRGFDWSFHGTEGVAAEPSANRVRLSGRQPEHWRILSQRVPVKPQRVYEFRFQGSAPSGVHWKVLERDMLLEQSSGPAGVLRFRAGLSPVTVALDYDRPRGETRLAGIVIVAGLSMHVAGTP